MKLAMPKLSIRITLLATIAVLNTIIAGQAGVYTLTAWHNYRDTEEMRTASEKVYLLYAAQKDLSLERAASMAIPYASAKEKELLRKELNDNRASADAAMQSSLSTLTAAEDPSLAPSLDQADADYALVRNLRRLSDRQPDGGAEDAGSPTSRIFDAQSALISDLSRIIIVYSDRHLAQNASLVRRQALARAIWNVTEYAGRQYALLGRMIVRQKRPSDAESRELAGWQGRIDNGWETIEAYVTASEWGPNFRNNIDEAKTEYVMTFEQIKGIFSAAAGAAGAIYPISIDMWLGLSSQALDSLYTMMDTSIELNRDYIIDVRAVAARNITLSALLLAGALILSFYTWRLITRRVTRPINLMVEALYRATRGEDAELPAIAFGDDEVGKLATVLEKFKENARDLQTERDRARAANIAKSEFLANMSHEIRTPMNVVLGIANLLSTSQPSPQKQKEFVRTLRISAESLLSIINDLLDISKIETGHVELEQIPFVLKSIVDETATLISLKANEKGLAVDVDVAALEGKEFVGDPTRVRQILMNLCSNAVKFTAAGRITITASATPSSIPGVEDVYISIRDTGVGIPAEKLPLIFEKFTQADSSISRKFGGTGLGLSIAKAFAEMMRGSITVNSAEGEGSTFTIFLPLRLRRKGIAVASEVPLQAPKAKAADGAGRRVLLVEDYSPNAIIAGAFLDQFGYAYDLAENGHQAVEKAGSRHYDAILMDVQMPGMDGYQATRAIRKLEEHSADAPSRIIGMTAYALPGDREKCLEAGMDDYLPKPFSPADLQEKLGAQTAGASPVRDAKRVLVVDDNTDSANTLAWSLEALGHETRVAGDGREAVEVAKEFRPDFVLLDIGLPGSDGYEVCSILRKIPDLKNARIIAQTGWAEDADRSRVAGFNGHLVKPVTIDTLRKVLSSNH